jgi:hypothetical protein
VSLGVPVAPPFWFLLFFWFLLPSSFPSSLGLGNHHGSLSSCTEIGREWRPYPPVPSGVFDSSFLLCSFLFPWFGVGSVLGAGALGGLVLVHACAGN